MRSIGVRSPPGPHPLADRGGRARGQPVRRPRSRPSRLAKVVVIGVPGLTWSDVQASPELTALVDQSNVGSITVKTAGPHTCPIDGWLTISAGTRAWGSVPDQPCGDLPAVTDGKVAGWQTYVDRQAEHHTGAPIGRLGAGRLPDLRLRPGCGDRTGHDRRHGDQLAARVRPGQAGEQRLR